MLSNQSLETEVKKRRTFAIISHPDAGKTTITEQLLLLGGVLRTAGTVKARKSSNFAKSDWMEIEKKRGISVTSSVMQFDYLGKHINILDTPGHEDFSEDTYRTLMAVDSAVMVIDAAKGIESQTKKLFKICKMRGIPIFTFINKLDRDGKLPLDLISEVEDVLDIEAYPMNWPIGMGKNLRGLYDIYHNRIELYKHNVSEFLPLNNKGKLINYNDLQQDSIYDDVIDEVNLLKNAGNEFNNKKINIGQLTPVFFGSALNNFGIKTFFDTYLEFAPSPSVHKTAKDIDVSPIQNEFSGFVFKIQANMNPNHRDRIAFVRVCSGSFEKGMEVTLNRTNKSIRLSNSTQFMADKRKTVDQAVSGDIIGLYDTGTFQIGDTIYTGKKKVQFKKLPQFNPEIFMRVSPKNVMKQKSYHKGIQQLVQEGAIQVYTDYNSNDYILGAVGQLQFEVFKFRMKNEYNSDIIMRPLGHKVARWILAPDKLDSSMINSRNLLVKDDQGSPLFLFDNEFSERWFKNKYPDIELISKL